MQPDRYPDAAELHGRLNRQGQPVHLVIHRRPSDVLRYRYRHDQEGQHNPNYFWEFQELELADGQWVLIARELRHADHWWLFRILALGERLTDPEGGQHHTAWHEPRVSPE